MRPRRERGAFLRDPFIRGAGPGAGGERKYEQEDDSERDHDRPDVLRDRVLQLVGRLADAGWWLALVLVTIAVVFGTILGVFTLVVLSRPSVRELFGDEDGGFYFSAANAKDLIVRQKISSDSPLPSGNAVAAMVMLLGSVDAAAQILRREYAESGPLTAARAVALGVPRQLRPGASAHPRARLAAGTARPLLPLFRAPQGQQHPPRLRRRSGRQSDSALLLGRRNRFG